MARKYVHYEFAPKYCWVNESKKLCYDSEEEAIGAARQSEYEHGLKPHSLHAYHCDMCGDWHIAHVRSRARHC